MNSQYLQGFKKGLSFIPQRDQKEIKEKLLQAIGINNDVSWYKYLNGRISPTIEQAIAINNVFADYGIKESNVWGKEDK